jgi:hypothetical protein
VASIVGQRLAQLQVQVQVQAQAQEWVPTEWLL